MPACLKMALSPPAPIVSYARSIDSCASSVCTPHRAREGRVSGSRSTSAVDALHRRRRAGKCARHRALVVVRRQDGPRRAAARRTIARRPFLRSSTGRPRRRTEPYPRVLRLGRHLRRDPSSPTPADRVARTAVRSPHATARRTSHLCVRGKLANNVGVAHRRARACMAHLVFGASGACTSRRSDSWRAARASGVGRERPSRRASPDAAGSAGRAGTRRCARDLRALCAHAPSRTPRCASSRSAMLTLREPRDARSGYLSDAARRPPVAPLVTAPPRPHHAAYDAETEQYKCNQEGRLMDGRARRRRRARPADADVGRYRRQPRLENGRRARARGGRCACAKPKMAASTGNCHRRPCRESGRDTARRPRLGSRRGRSCATCHGRTSCSSSLNASAVDDDSIVIARGAAEHPTRRRPEASTRRAGENVPRLREHRCRGRPVRASVAFGLRPSTATRATSTTENEPAHLCRGGAARAARSSSPTATPTACRAVTARASPATPRPPCRGERRRRADRVAAPTAGRGGF